MVRKSSFLAKLIFGGVEYYRFGGYMKNMGYSRLVNKKEDSLRGPEEPRSPDKTTHSQEDDLNLCPTNRIMILKVNAHRKHLGHLLTEGKSIGARPRNLHFSQVVWATGHTVSFSSLSGLADPSEPR